MEDFDWLQFYNEWNRGGHNMRHSKAWDKLSTIMFNLYRSSILKKLKKHAPLSSTYQDVDGCLNLLGAIYEYRQCPNVEVFLARDYSFYHERDHIKNLWREFNSISNVRLSDMAIDMIHEIETALGEL